MGIVSKEVAKSGKWKVTPEEELEEMREECRADKAAKIVRLSDKAIGREIDKVMSKVEAEVCHSARSPR